MTPLIQFIISTFLGCIFEVRDRSIDPNLECQKENEDEVIYAVTISSIAASIRDSKPVVYAIVKQGAV